jgi:hypothetical protein
MGLETAERFLMDALSAKAEQGDEYPSVWLTDLAEAWREAGGPSVETALASLTRAAEDLEREGLVQGNYFSHVGPRELEVYLGDAQERWEADRESGKHMRGIAEALERRKASESDQSSEKP